MIVSLYCVRYHKKFREMQILMVEHRDWVTKNRVEGDVLRETVKKGWLLQMCVGHYAQHTPLECLTPGFYGNRK